MLKETCKLVAEDVLELLRNRMFGRILTGSAQTLAEAQDQVAQLGNLTDAVRCVGRLMQVFQSTFLHASIYIQVRQRHVGALAAR